MQGKLRKRWSPEQISRRLAAEFPDRPEMRVSHETIYQSLYVQGRGALRRELAVSLRTGRALRKPRRATGERRGKIAGMVSISERPAEAADRAVPGHWEGDLLMGAAGKSAIGTLVERTTRFTMLVPLPADHAAPAVAEALTPAIAGLPDALRRSLTWDQGWEMRSHAQIAVDADVEIYFCDPHSPGQRGSNENTNGLLRQYFPKGTSLAGYTPDQLAAVADELNGLPARPWAGRPRPRRWLRSWTATPPDRLSPISVAADAAAPSRGVPRSVRGRPSGLKAAHASPAATALRACVDPGDLDGPWAAAATGQAQPAPRRARGTLDRNRPYIVGAERVIYRRCCNDPLSPRQL